MIFTIGSDPSEVKVAKSCPTLCDPIDYTVHGILQTRILEWVAFCFSRGSSQPRNWTQASCIADRFFPSWAVREGSDGRWWKHHAFPWLHSRWCKSHWSCTSQMARSMLVRCCSDCWMCPHCKLDVTLASPCISLLSAVGVFLHQKFDSNALYITLYFQCSRAYWFKKCCSKYFCNVNMVHLFL